MDTILTCLSLKVHLDLYRKDKGAYVSYLENVLNTNPDLVNEKSKPYICAVLLKDMQKKTTAMLLSTMKLPEVLTTCKILDGARTIKAIDKKLLKMDRQYTGTQKYRKNFIKPEYQKEKLLKELTGGSDKSMNDLAKKLEKAAKRVRNFERNYVDGKHVTKRYNVKRVQLQTERDGICMLLENEMDFRLNSSHAKVLCAWVRSIPARALEFYALEFPREQWQKFAKYVHPKPSDFALDWFLKYVCTGDKQGIEFLKKFETVDESNYKDVIDSGLGYNFLRTRISVYRITNEMKNYIVQHEELDKVVWWWSELDTPSTRNILMSRLKMVNDEILPKFNYGTVMKVGLNTSNENVLGSVAKLGQKLLTRYTMELDQPVAVLGDASASMNVAIRTATVISTLLTTLVDAEFRLFNDRDHLIEPVPKNVLDCLKLARKLRANSMTSPAVSLLPYYKEKKVVKTFIVVTDEEENTPVSLDDDQNKQNQQDNGLWQIYFYRQTYGRTSINRGNRYRFAELFKKYHDEVYPAKLILISFTRPSVTATMERELQTALGTDRTKELLTVYKMDTGDPDLKKIDSILIDMCRSSIN